MWNDCFRAAKGHEGSFDRTARRVRQWKALLDTIKLGDLVTSLLTDPPKGNKQRLIERFEYISSHMSADQRAIFLIDPFDTLAAQHASTWGIVFEALPRYFTLVFAQRPEDVLAQHDKINTLTNLTRIDLGTFTSHDMREITSHFESALGIPNLDEALDRYRGHPYGVMAAIALLADGTPLNELPDDPSGIARAQWKQICAKGADFVDIFKAHAILEINVDDELVSDVSGIQPSRIQECRSDPFISGLLTTESGNHFRIYHDILQHLVRQRITRDEESVLHSRALSALRERMDTDRRDVSFALRLPEHELQLNGSEAYAKTVAFETAPLLIHRWNSDAAEDQLRRAIQLCPKGSRVEWVLRGHLGVVMQRLGEYDEALCHLDKALRNADDEGDRPAQASYLRHIGKIHRVRSDYDQAADIYRRSLDLSKALEDEEGMAADYSNLGTVFQRQEKWDEARHMHESALALNAKINTRKSRAAMAINYGCLGVIARKVGDLQTAEDMHRKSLTLNRRFDNQQGAAVNLNNLGNVMVDAQRYDEAEALYAESLEISRYLEHKDGIAVARLYLGRVFEKRRQTDIGKRPFQPLLTGGVG